MDLHPLQYHTFACNNPGITPIASSETAQNELVAPREINGAQRKISSLTLQLPAYVSKCLFIKEYRGIKRGSLLPSLGPSTLGINCRSSFYTDIKWVCKHVCVQVFSTHLCLSLIHI